MTITLKNTNNFVRILKILSSNFVILKCIEWYACHVSLLYFLVELNYKPCLKEYEKIRQLQRFKGAACGETFSRNISMLKVHFSCYKYIALFSIFSINLSKLNFRNFWQFLVRGKRGCHFFLDLLEDLGKRLSLACPSIFILPCMVCSKLISVEVDLERLETSWGIAVLSKSSVQNSANWLCSTTILVLPYFSQQFWYLSVGIVNCLS